MKKMFFPAVLAALSVSVFTARSATAANGSLTPHFKQSSYVNESVTLENKYVTMNFFKRIKGWGWGEILTPEGKLMAVMGMGIRQGETITVTGLLTGGDILAALTPEVCEGMKEIMLCSVTLRHEQDRFLDDMTIDEFRRRAPLPVRLVDCDGQSLYDGLHGRGLD